MNYSELIELHVFNLDLIFNDIMCQTLLKILIRYLINLLNSSWIQFMCYVSTLFKIQSQNSLKLQMFNKCWEEISC